MEYKKTTKKGTVNIQFKDIPQKVKSLLRKRHVNWVEEGICCDLSTTRGYFCDTSFKLHQKTGGRWAFFHTQIYTKNIDMKKELAGER